MDYALKFKELRKYFDLTQEQFAQDLGVSRSVVSQIEINRFDPSIQLIAAANVKFNIPLKYFFNDSLTIHDVLKSTGNINENAQVHAQVTAKNDRKKDVKIIRHERDQANEVSGVPFYEQLIATAGDFTDILQSSTPTSYLNLPQISDCNAVIPVHGSSMKGLIESGDLIAIKEVKSRSEFDPSLPYLVITNEHRMIKYLRADPENEAIIWADSTNHKPIKLDAGNILLIYAIKCVIRLF